MLLSMGNTVNVMGSTTLQASDVQGLELRADGSGRGLRLAVQQPPAESWFRLRLPAAAAAHARASPTTRPAWSPPRQLRRR